MRKEKKTNPKHKHTYTHINTLIRYWIERCLWNEERLYSAIDRYKFIYIICKYIIPHTYTLAALDARKIKSNTCENNGRWRESEPCHQPSAKQYLFPLTFGCFIVSPNTIAILVVCILAFPYYKQSLKHRCHLVETTKICLFKFCLSTFYVCSINTNATLSKQANKHLSGVRSSGA